jgi:ribosomal protein L7/L12/cold shock CspA family protein
MEGIVKYYSELMGFGFIRSTLDNSKYYVHVSGIIDLIKAGDRVSFELFQHEKGLRAVKVKQRDENKIKGPLQLTKNKLQKLSMQNGASLTSLEGLQHMHLIEEIDLSGCSDLKSIDELGTLPLLNQLNLENCKKLTSIEVLDIPEKPMKVITAGCENMKGAYFEKQKRRSRLQFIESAYNVDLVFTDNAAKNFEELLKGVRIDNRGHLEYGNNSIFLEKVGESKLEIVKAVKELKYMGLKEAKTLVDNAPIIIPFTAIDNYHAESFKKKCLKYGAKVHSLGANEVITLLNECPDEANIHPSLEPQNIKKLTIEPSFKDVNKENLLRWIEKLHALENLQLNCQTVLSLAYLTKFPKLQYLRITGNGLTAVDLSQNKELVVLDLAGNRLKEIDLSANSKLTHLNLKSNCLTKIDLSVHTELTHLNVSYNELDTLDLSKNTKVHTLSFASNKCTNIDLSGKELTYLWPNNRFEFFDESTDALIHFGYKDGSTKTTPENRDKIPWSCFGIDYLDKELELIYLILESGADMAPQIAIELMNGLSQEVVALDRRQSLLRTQVSYDNRRIKTVAEFLNFLTDKDLSFNYPPLLLARLLVLHHFHYRETADYSDVTVLGYFSLENTENRYELILKNLRIDVAAHTARIKFCDPPENKLGELYIIFQQGIRTMLRKKYGTDAHIDIVMSLYSSIEILLTREIVSDGDVDDTNKQIAYSEAIEINPDFEVGEEVTEHIWLYQDDSFSTCELRLQLIKSAVEYLPWSYGVNFSGEASQENIDNFEQLTLIEKACLFSKLMEDSNLDQIAKSQPLEYEELIHFLSNGTISTNGAINWQNIAMQLIVKNFLMSSIWNDVKGHLDFILRAIKHCPKEAKIHPSIRSEQTLTLNEVKFDFNYEAVLENEEDNYKPLIEFIQGSD